MVDGSSTFNLISKLTTEFLNQPFAPQKASIQQPAAQSLPKTASTGFAVNSFVSSGDTATV